MTDDDIPIQVAVPVAGDRIAVDFGGTAGAVGGNVNCPLSVTRSACFFALRVLLPDDIPANAGTYAPLEIIAPEGSLVNARRPSAVVAGNVETSQRLADTVLDALAQTDRRAGRRAGHHEQCHHRWSGLDVLRDHRRRAGRRRRAPGPVRGARRDVEHAQHAR